MQSDSSTSWQPTAHSPWYRTVLRGTGFQLRPSVFSHPTRNSRNKSFVPPIAPISAPIRWNWRCPVVSQNSAGHFFVLFFRGGVQEFTLSPQPWISLSKEH
ncbi:hypothetical protein EYF80_013414 [Liparis tanakae]|uniref:Uncharacterized protein n=1 Tax=Liparis tanakae TaxID=230148 RepID=A0A4Z2IFG5_9TELE|nr:hypothetical protein EYF80_013414 [Liparis tanakae]